MTHASADQPSTPAIPDHVPAHRVRHVQWYGQHVADGDANAALASVSGGLDLFYVPRNDRNPYGSWVPTRYEDIQKVFSDTEHFTSNHIAGFNLLSGLDQLLVPIEFDPPDHGTYRAFMNPFFTRDRLLAYKPVMEAAVDGVIDQIIDSGRADIVPWCFRMMAPIWCKIMGAPPERSEEYIQLMFAFTHQYDPALRFANARHMLEVMQALYRELKDAHGTGLINAFINAQIKGRRPTESECGGFILFMFLAGIDTMGSTSAWLLRHLALHPAERRDLIDNPDRRAAFVEEGFRRYATVSPNRFVKKETQICGVTLKPGDNVVVSAPFACMDPARYEDPAAFVMNRKSRNLAFGAGSHFCIGAQLSRLQLPAMLDRWLARIPHFAIAPGCRPTAHMGDVTALDSLPLAWPI